ncbi:UPF0390 protein zgc136864-like [Rhopilema esculentum]|uniref:UPF0390 protein zgc136864-like n=1 Tax=Rhopilema esculentum TaxID=499914 RepID=UPI0031E03D50
MPQGLRKLTAKKPNDIKIKTSKDKVKKQSQRMKKGAMKIAPKKKKKQEEAKMKELLQKEYNKALEKELTEKAGADNLRVVQKDRSKK